MLRRLVFAVIAAPILLCAVASAQSLDEIVAKHVAALGGAERIKAVKSFRATGTFDFGFGFAMPVTLTVALPKSARMEVTFQGMAMTQATDGTTAWSVNGFMGQGVKKMSAAEATTISDSAEIFGPLVDWKARGESVSLIGKIDLEGSPAYKLKVTKTSGAVSDVYVETESFLIIQIGTKDAKTDMRVTTSFGDFKQVQGLTLPHSMQTKLEGMPAGQALTWNKIEVNPVIAPAIFAMPAGGGD